MSVESSSPERSSTAETLIRELGRTGASGVLEMRHQSGVPSYVWVRGGRIYAMQVPGYRPALGIRLLSGGLVSPEQLSAAAAEQRERRPGQLIGEVLVGMGYVGTDVIDAFVRQQVIDQIGDLLDLEIHSAEFHVGRHIRQGMSQPSEIEELLAAAHDSRARRTEVLARVGGPAAVPVLGPSQGGPSRTPLGPYDWALLCRVDGTRDLTELARVCGFTVMEAAQVVSDLMRSGLLALPGPGTEDDGADLAPVVALRSDQPPAEPQWQFDGTDAGEPDPVHDVAGPAEAEDGSGALLAEFGALLRDDQGAGPPARPEDVDEASDSAQPALAEVALLQPLVPQADPSPVPEEPLAAADPGQYVSSAEPIAPEPDPAQPPVAEAAADVAQPQGAAEAPPVSEPRPAPASDPAPPGLSLVEGAGRAPLAVVEQEEQPAREAPTEAADAGSDTTAFMRELSSLSDDPDRAEPVVRRLVVPLKEQRRRRRPWSR